MNDKEKELLITGMLKSKKIKETYDDYIIKEISFENWVRHTVYDLMDPVQVDADAVLTRILGDDNDKIGP